MADDIGEEFCDVVTLAGLPAFHTALVGARSIDEHTFASAMLGFGGAPSEALVGGLCAIAAQMCMPGEGSGVRGGGGVGSWMAGIRSLVSPRASDHVDYPGAVQAFCCGLVPFCDGELEEKVHAGFAIAGRQTMDLHELLSLMQSSFEAAQRIAAALFSARMPRGMPARSAPLLKYQWEAVEDWLREGVLAPLVGVEEEMAADKKLINKIFAARGGLPRFSAAQLWVMVQQHTPAGGADAWEAAIAFVSERAASLSIDRSLRAEQQRKPMMLEVLLVGRSGSGRNTLLSSLQVWWPRDHDT